MKHKSDIEIVGEAVIFAITVVGSSILIITVIYGIGSLFYMLMSLLTSLFNAG